MKPLPEAGLGGLLQDVSPFMASHLGFSEPQLISQDLPRLRLRKCLEERLGLLEQRAIKGLTPPYSSWSNSSSISLPLHKVSRKQNL
jgi:hypothetical protein